MRPERAFIAERALAQHCAELVRASPPPADLLPQLARCGERLAIASASALQPLIGGEPPAVSAAPPSECAWGELASEFAPLAANSLLGIGSDNAPLLLSLDAAPIFRLVDLAFGGRGAAPAQLPDAFPMSAELMIARLETMMIGLIEDAFAIGEGNFIRPVRRDGNIDLLLPFEPDIRTAVLPLTVTEVSGASWTARLVLPLATLAALLGCAQSGTAGKRTVSRPPGLSAEPLGAVPLSLRAVLVDMAMPVSAIWALEPGQILPVSVARSVPLRIGATTIAHGTIGTLDERIAVQITHVF